MLAQECRGQLGMLAVLSSPRPVQIMFQPAGMCAKQHLPARPALRELQAHALEHGALCPSPPLSCSLSWRAAIFMCRPAFFAA